MSVQIRFLGSGDAFGSGGRFQACILVSTARTRVLLSHLHGDHFGGLPFFILDAQLVSKRTRPLVIAGPLSTKARLVDAMEVLFPGSSGTQQRFSLDVLELEPERQQRLGELTVTPYLVHHACGAPPLALRIECDGKTIAYSGDTEWTAALVPAARDADLLIAEAYFFEKTIRYHLDYRTLTAHLAELRPKRLILTHMSQEMLARLGTLGCEYAEDGKVIEL